jgi:hypothetical protein
VTSVAASSRVRAGQRSAGARVGAPGAEPWRRGHALVTGVLGAVGAVLLVWGWYGSSGTVDLNSQTRWLALGILGLIVGGLGMSVWLLAGLRAVTDLKREVLDELSRRLPVEAAAAAPAGSAPGTTALGTAPGMRRYHRAECLMIAGKDATWAEAHAHVEAGLVPCGVCRPEAKAS